MEIIQKKSSLSKFKVLKPFRWGGFETEIGMEIELNEPTATQMVISKHVEPLWPDLLECVCLADLRLPGRDAAHVAKRMERVLLRKKEAIELMIQRRVLPVDSNIWRPYSMKLKTGNEPRARTEIKKVNAADVSLPHPNSKVQDEKVKVHFNQPVKITDEGKIQEFKKGDKGEVSEEVAEQIFLNKGGTLTD